MHSGITRLLLIGAGPAHLAVLHRLAQHHRADLQVTLLAPHPHHTHTALLHALIAGRVEAEHARVPLVPLLEAAHTRAFAGRCLSLDTQTRTVYWQPVEESPPQAVVYDLLSIDTAATVDRERLQARWPGAREHALALWPLDAFLPLWNEVVALAQRQPLSLAVLGAHTAAVETVFAAAERLRRDGQPGATFTLVTGGPEAGDGLPAGVQRALRERLRDAGIQVLREPCTRIDAEGVHLGNGGLLRCDAPLLAPEGDAPAWLGGSGLAVGEDGRALVNGFQQSSSHPEVFVSGAAARRMDAPPARPPAPVAGAAPLLAQNLEALHEGRPLQAHKLPAVLPGVVHTDGDHALGHRGAWRIAGAWLGRWKDRQDLRWVAQQSSAGGTAGARPSTPKPQTEDVRREP